MVKTTMQSGAGKKKGMNVLMVASEVFPYVKTGGLADVTGGLPPALSDAGMRVRTLLPGYRQVLEQDLPWQPIAALPDLFGGDAQLLGAVDPATSLDLIMLRADHLFDRDGGPYAQPDGRDWPDNIYRFAALSWAARDLALGIDADWRPDIVHCHDWQAGLLPAYLHGQAGRPGTVLTIHNIAFQGVTGPEFLTSLRLTPEQFSIEGVEYHGLISTLKAGIYYADAITTVSPSYAREIQSDSFGMGLQGLLRSRTDRLFGVVNGIDGNAWDPAGDSHLTASYTASRLKRRQVNKREAAGRLGIELDPSRPLLCVVSRLTWQKGMDILLFALDAMLAEGVQLAVVGSGDRELEDGFRAAQRRHPGGVGCFIGYDEGLSHLLQGGADAILVPSRFEPCGLTQLFGQRYGCVPVVSRVGGLADTIIDANHAGVAEGVATGVFMPSIDPEGLLLATRRCVELFHDPKVWSRIQRRGMARDLSWAPLAEQYASIYRGALRD